MEKILVAHDGSKAADRALKLAVALSARSGGELSVVSVVPNLYLTRISEKEQYLIMKSLTDETTVKLEKIRQLLAGQKTSACKTLIRHGDPAEKILETALKMKADLIVLGPHGTHVKRGFVTGSVARKVVDYSRCSVLIAR